MKGIILAGGQGTRLRPLTDITNKHLIAVYDKPIILYPLERLTSAGIKDIMIVSGRDHVGHFLEYMGSGHDFGVNFTYKVQDTAGGIAHALLLAEDFVGSDKFVSINGDNILFDDIKPFVEEFAKGKEKSRVLIYETTREEAAKAGVAVLEGDRVVKVVEKPKNPPTNWVVVGVYMYTPEVFGAIKNLKPSARGELEIADVHNFYIKNGALRASRLKKEWLDAGSFDELLRVNRIVGEKKGGKGV